jgi:hypothetical protein
MKVTTCVGLGLSILLLMTLDQFGKLMLTSCMNSVTKVKFPISNVLINGDTVSQLSSSL